ncbi:WXG100 family type VII secretion target [Bacillus thuringiensis]|uniref:WXG100 family type VII secretion target n=1 Tax=Bacillus cereus group TaxID=86661 RepID=UPI001298C780|nr:WXG100 family type VII secretion target [Bacillus thuringiensis]MEB9419985.1 WXG100 family type VII secretion target [Bacillus cereus]MEB9509422.1 WXG100 family type VII secretion target [Bacillus cereus]MEB9561517.1 WXG100 family type VII secretion target [Bacillus cereus]MRC02843.1 WXG100 family type VII secretion target [Bacillus thuringiensis]MRC76569.1 WXG100 family type VII secretion target [Bacillus thuringiensis]
MTQIKVTPERLEQAAKTVQNTRNSLEYIHKDLCNQTEYIASQWSGATSNRFYQMFNDTKPKMFSVLQILDNIADQLTHAADKFRNADQLYGGNLVENSNVNTSNSSDQNEEADMGKLTRDLAGELTGEYDVRRVFEGVDPDTGKKLSWWERSLAGVMVVAGITPIGKGVKILKSGKKVANALDAAVQLEKRRETLAKNSKAGDVFEKEMEAIIRKEKVQSELNNQVTIMTKSGVRTRLDIAGKGIDGKIDLIELKSSPTAPLTKNQKKAFPEIEESGAIVRSRSKPPFEYLEEIPPTKVTVIRKND